MFDSREIVLAGKTYKITVPLTLAQLIKCSVGMAIEAPPGTAATEMTFDRMLNVITAAMQPENPEITVDFLRNLRGATMKELNAAATVVYEESGLIPKKLQPQGDFPTGEAKAA